MDIRKLQRAIIDGLEDVKAQNIAVFNTEHLSSMFERVIVASGTSNRQTKALAASVRDAVRDLGYPILSTEGEDNGEWIIVDCGAAVVHVMQPGIREYYHLEEIWGDKPVKLKLATGGTKLVKASEGDDEDSAPAKKATKKAAKPLPAAKPVAAKRGGSRAEAAEKPAAKTARKAAAAPVAPAKKVAAKKVAAKSAAKPVATPAVVAKKAPAKTKTIVVGAPATRKPAAKKAAPAKKAPAKKPVARKTATTAAKPAAKPAVKKAAAKTAVKAPAKKTTARKTAR
jgi:ribosome-associated protein